MGIFNLFGGSTSVASIEQYLENGAVVIDVRTIEEFEEGHVQVSKNIPLNTIGSHLDEIKNLNKPVITCCRSGARSELAKELLLDENFDVINGGPWQNIENYI